MDIYKQFSQQVQPIIVLNFIVEEKYYDVNVSPDKREVFLKNEAEVVKELKTKLEEFFDGIQRSKLVENLKKKQDSYNPHLDEEDNAILKNLQKKKVIGGKEESGEMKMSQKMKKHMEIGGRMSQYKENLARKRKMDQQEKESKALKEREDQLKKEEFEEQEKEVPTIQRLKVEESEEEDDEEQKEGTFASDDRTLSISERVNKMSKQIEERAKAHQKLDPRTQIQKQKDFLSKFKAASRRVHKTSVEKEEVDVEKEDKKPKDYMSMINRKFTPTNVTYVDKENDPAYELNKALLEYDDEKMKAFKRQKIEIINKTVNLDGQYRSTQKTPSDKDITRESADPSQMDTEHPMDCEKLVFMDKLPVMSGFDNEDTEIFLDISTLPLKIEQEKLRYSLMEERKLANVLTKRMENKKSAQKDKFDT
jgi:hypothetical protein